MIRIFIDTCTWIHWFSFQSKQPLKANLLKHAENFDKIFQIVSSRPQDFKFLYNERVRQEMSKKFKTDFETILVSGIFDERIPIPLSRHDGTYKHDGALLYGGKYGGALRGILDLYGYNHEAELRKAKRYKIRGDRTYTNPRLMEFDVEHLESALEAKAAMFITDDEKLVRRLTDTLKTRTAGEGDQEALERAIGITFLPTTALIKLSLM